MAVGHSRVLALRFPGSCAGCGAHLARGERAWWDANTKEVWCVGCRTVGDVAEPGEEPPSPGAAAANVDPGEAGRSAQREFERRRARRAQRIERTWGPLAGVVKFVTDEPQTTRAWAKGAAGERRVASHLQRVIGDRASFLHDRRVPGGRANIDLLVVASSGVWIVDSKHWSGRVQRRRVGGWPSSDLRLYVGRRDCEQSVESLGKQMMSVSRALGSPDVPVTPALCFVEADWGWFARPFRYKGVWISWAQRLAELILQPGSLDRPDVENVTAGLAARLPAK